MHLLLFTGFLGSGKTTLVIRLANRAINRGKKAAILVNEIGEVGIDNQLMKQLDMNVWELLNGCICCTLSTELVTTLHKLDCEYSPDLVIVEPSGAADPQSILKVLPFYKGKSLESVYTVSILDPQRAEMLIEVMTPLVVSQIQHADLILVSKCDLAKPEEIDFAHRTAREQNPTAPILDFGLDTPLELLIDKAARWMN